MSSQDFEQRVQRIIDENREALQMLADHDRDEPIKQTSPDRAHLTHDDREMCRACGELPATEGMYCRRCWASLEDDRLERESNR
jgi:hypothetical protein